MSEINSGGSFERGSRISHSHIINDEEVLKTITQIN